MAGRRMSNWPTLRGYLVTFTFDTLPHLGDNGLLHAHVAALDETRVAEIVRTSCADALKSAVGEHDFQRHLDSLRIVAVSPGLDPSGRPQSQPDTSDPKAPNMTDTGIEFSDYDFMELIAFHSKVESEGFTYAYENYPPKFEAEPLQRTAQDMGSMRRLFSDAQDRIDRWWADHPDDGVDLHNEHIDDRRERDEADRLWAVHPGGDFARKYLWAFETRQEAEAVIERNLEHARTCHPDKETPDWRLLHREVPAGEWDTVPRTAE